MTILDDPQFEYPEELSIYSMWRYEGGKQIPPLKGVKTLKIANVRGSLDFSHTGVDKVIIGELSTVCDPNSKNDYSNLLPLSEFLTAHKNPPCVIKCRHIEVDRSFGPFCRCDTDEQCANHDCNTLLYDCDYLSIKNIRNSLTSTCKTFVNNDVNNMSPDDKHFIVTPNVRPIN